MGLWDTIDPGGLFGEDSSDPPDSGGASTDEREGSSLPGGPGVPDDTSRNWDDPDDDERDDRESTFDDVNISWGELAPWWLKTDRAENLLKNPVNFILVTIIAAVLGVIDSILNQFRELWALGAEAINLAIFESITAAFGPYIETGFMLLGWLETGIRGAAASYGIAAPYVTLVLWMTAVLFIALIGNAVIGFIGTYLPLNSIPLLRRVV